MSKNEENNSHIIVKNNSIQNLNMHNHNKNKSSNFLTDSPSTLISVQLHSINSNKNSKNKDREKISSNNTNNISNQIKSKKESSITNKNNNNDSLQDLNNIRLKLSKISSQYSATTPKQLANIYNQLCNGRVDPGNIVIKKNLKLGNESQSNSNMQNSCSHRNKRNNDLVKYVNNDKHNNLKENFLNMTQNYSKYILPQSKSFVNLDKKNSKKKVYNKSQNNTNAKKGNKNMTNNKRVELSGLAKSSNNLYKNYYSKNINNENNNEINYIYNNKKTEGNIHQRKKEQISEDISDITNTVNNNNKNKKIYLMKPVYKRKKSYENNNNKSIENSNINTNQSSICSKNRSYKNICDDNILNDFFNNKIENPEELHFFYVKILQNAHEVSKRFEND